MKARETVLERQARLQCPTCRKWYMVERQRDAHAVKTHGAHGAHAARIYGTATPCTPAQTVNGTCHGCGFAS